MQDAYAHVINEYERIGERKLQYNHERVSKIIASCVILHYFLIKYTGDVDSLDEYLNAAEHNIGQNRGANQPNDVVRDQLAEQLFNYIQEE